MAHIKFTDNQTDPTCHQSNYSYSISNSDFTSTDNDHGLKNNQEEVKKRPLDIVDITQNSVNEINKIPTDFHINQPDEHRHKILYDAQKAWMDAASNSEMATDHTDIGKGIILTQTNTMELTHTHMQGFSYRFGNIANATASSYSQNGYILTKQTSETGQGIGIVTEIGVTGSSIIFGVMEDLTAGSLTIDAQNNMRKAYNNLEQEFEGYAIKCDTAKITASHLKYKSDISKMLVPLNQLLSKKGYVPINGNFTTAKITSIILKMQAANESPEVIDAVKAAFISIRQQTIIASNGKGYGPLPLMGHTSNKRCRRLMKRQTRKYLRQTETGRGLIITSDLLTYSWHAFRGAVKISLSGGKLSWRIGKAVQKATLKTAIGRSATESIITSYNATVGKPIHITKKLIQDTHLKTNTTLGRFRNSLHNFYRQTPFGRMQTTLIKRFTQFGHWFLNTKAAKYSSKFIDIINLPRKILANLLYAVKTIGNALKTIAGSYIVIMILAIIIIVLISVFTEGISEAFNINTNISSEMAKTINQTIHDCWTQQNRSIQALYDKYDSVNITYKTIRNDDAYKQNAPDVDITETTNSAEIFSMVNVYFDFNPEAAGTDKVTAYVRQLYNGSHRINLSIRTYEEEKKIHDDALDIDYTIYEPKTEANVTVTTYYFDQIFSCMLSNSQLGIYEGDTTTEMIWNFLITSTLADGTPINEIMAASIMGNLQAESNFDFDLNEVPWAHSGDGYGIAQWSFGRKFDLINYARKRGVDVSDSSLQLEFLIYEMSGNWGHTYHGVTGQWPTTNIYNRWVQACNEGNLELATAIYYSKFERAYQCDTSYDPTSINWNSSCYDRCSNAQSWYDTYQGSRPSISGTYNVLFVGASTTTRAGLPNKFAKLAASSNYKVNVDIVSKNGATLDKIAEAYKDTITRKKYDYVVIQEGTANLKNYNLYLADVKKITNLVRMKNSRVKIILRQMWMYDYYKESGLLKVWNNTDKIKKELNLYAVSKDGPAFLSAYNKGISVYVDDGHHQSETGAYLAACCIYKAVFGLYTSGNSYSGGLSNSLAKQLQQIADKQ